MLDKLEQIETRYQELTNELSSAELLANPSAYGKAAKQHRALGEIISRLGVISIYSLPSYIEVAIQEGMLADRNRAGVCKSRA